MKNLVVYSSKTDNTKKLAEAIYDYLPGDNDIKSIEEAPVPDDYTFVAVGFWIKAGEPDAEAQQYLAKFREDHELFLFATHASATGSEMVKKAMNHAKELAGRARIVGVFDCPGEVSEQTIKEAEAKNPPPPWLADAAAAKGHPDEQDIKRLIQLMQDLDLP